MLLGLNRFRACLNLWSYTTKIPIIIIGLLDTIMIQRIIHHEFVEWKSQICLSLFSFLLSPSLILFYYILFGVLYCISMWPTLRNIMAKAYHTKIINGDKYFKANDQNLTPIILRSRQISGCGRYVANSKRSRK